MSFTLLHGQSSSGRSYWRKGAKTGTLNSRDLGGICVGQAAPHVELQILDEELVRDGGSRNIEFFGQNLQNGLFREGRVLTRGLHVMERYWGLPEETAAVLSRDGWLDTGDVGWMDGDGQLWLLGRHKDTIKSGGENVYSLEVSLQNIMP
jgi:acyl-activating enzyme 14